MRVNLRKICNASPGICQPSRGFADLGRSGPQAGRRGEKVDGKIRCFRTEGCAVPEREAWSGLRPASGTMGELLRHAAIAVEGVQHRAPLPFLSRGEGTGLDRSSCSSRHPRGRLNATYAHALLIPRMISRSEPPACAAQAVQGGHKTPATMIARMRLFFGKADSGVGTVLLAPRRLRGRGPSLLRCYESLLRVPLALFFMPT